MIYIIHFIKSLGTKDIDIGLYEGVESVFNDNTLEYEDLLNIYHTDTNSVPFLIHENFINYIDKNTNNKLNQKIDICIEYYDNFIDSLILKSNNFGYWELIDHIGNLNVILPNHIVKKSNVKSVINNYSLGKSSLISKYNYRYYNMKFINQLSKKLSISMGNFSLLSLLVSIAIFIEHDKLDYTINIFKDRLTSNEFQKIVKLSFIFEKYQKLFTKKVQNNIDSKFNS